MTDHPTPLAQRLRDIAGALVHEAAMADRPGQMDRLEEMSRDLRLAAAELSDHVTQTRQVYDLFAALVHGLNKTFRPEVPVDDDFSFVMVATDELAEVHDRWQVEIRSRPGGYALFLAARNADPIVSVTP